MNTQSPTGGEHMSLAEKTIRLLASLLEWKDDLEEALVHGGDTHGFDDITRGVVTGQLHLYDYGDCCIIMQVLEFPRKRNYHCFIACGNLKKLIEVQDNIAQVGKDLGCEELTLAGRTGFPRALKNYGWKHRLSTMYMEL